MGRENTDGTSLIRHMTRSGEEGARAVAEIAAQMGRG